jgi:transposase-like protein
MDMRKRELARMIEALGKLSRAERQMVVAEIAAADGQASSVAVIDDRVPERRDCPHCASRQVVKNGHADGLQRFKCRSCAKSFNALTGTPLSHLHQRAKWLGQASALRDGLVLREVAQRLNVALSTAHRWRHRFLAVPRTVQAQALMGIAEADESYFLRSCKGQRKGLGRAPRKRGGTAKQRGHGHEQVPVLIARDRTGSTANFVLEAATASAISVLLRPILPTDTVLCTDGSSTLAAVARNLGVEHHPINLTAGVRVIGAWHVQNVNAFGSRLRGWLRRFKGVATKYLANYLGWFRVLDRSPDFGPEPASLLALAIRS